MSESESYEVPVVAVESSSPSSTSQTISERSSPATSERAEESDAGPSTSEAVPLALRLSRRTGGGVTVAGSSSAVLYNPSVLEGEDADSYHSEDLPKTKRRLEGDFALRKNTLSVDLPLLSSEVDRRRFRLIFLQECGSMSDSYIHIPYEHFVSGLSLPLDPAFCDFLNLVRCQPAHVHPNGVRYFIAFTVLCRRVGVEVSENLLRTFFTVLRMNNLTLSLRPRPSVVSLFEPPPNKLSQWREKWVCVESRTGFAFYPKCRTLRPWLPLKRNTRYSDSDRRFLDFVRSELGDSPKTQSKIFLTSELIADESRHACGIGGPAADERRRELGLEDLTEYPMWRLHPGRGFTSECSVCQDPRSAGCPVAKGRIVAEVVLLNYFFLCVFFFS